MNRKVLVIGVLLLLPLGAVLLWLLVGAEQRERIAGADAALPRAEPASEFVLPEALQAVTKEAQRRAVHALIVHRRGHRVFEYFHDATAGTAMLDGGALAAAALDLSLADAGGELALATRAGLVSERLWLPLRAGDAWLSGVSAPDGSRCCIEARLDDWLRVGDLLLGGGAYLGERFVAADAVRALLAGRTLHWQGDEPLLAQDGAAFDLAPGQRLWLAPRRQLAIFVWADTAVARDTLLPNIVLRGLNDPSPAIGGGIGDIVPGH
jgi:hypothetical protein